MPPLFHTASGAAMGLNLQGPKNETRRTPCCHRRCLELLRDRRGAIPQVARGLGPARAITSGAAPDAEGASTRLTEGSTSARTAPGSTARPTKLILSAPAGAKLSEESSVASARPADGSAPRQRVRRASAKRLSPAVHLAGVWRWRIVAIIRPCFSPLRKADHVPAPSVPCQGWMSAPAHSQPMHRDAALSHPRRSCRVGGDASRAARMNGRRVRRNGLLRRRPLGVRR